MNGFDVVCYYALGLGFGISAVVHWITSSASDDWLFSVIFLALGKNSYDIERQKAGGR